MSAQGSLFSVCDSCGEEHDDGNWMLCHACAGPAFRAWYVGGALLKGESWRPVCGPLYEEACAIFAGLLGALVWRAA